MKKSVRDRGPVEPGRTVRRAAPTMRDVARHAGVSVATVSYVLNGLKGVSAERRRHVLAAIDELGFKPNLLARSLRRGHTKVLGLILLDIGNPFYPEIAAGVIEAAALAGYQVFVAHGGADGQFVQREAEALVEHRGDGIIFTSLVEAHRKILLGLLQTGVPCVMAVRQLRGVPADSVGINDRAAGRDAAKHLLRLGHKNIAVLAGPQDSAASRARLLGFEATLREAGMPLPRRFRLICQLTRDGGHQAMGRLLTLTGSRPSAVFCGNDMIAVGATDALIERDLRVPEDMAIVGYDDMSFASAQQIQLTSIHQPRAQIGRVSVQLLLDRLAHPDAPPKRSILPHHLVIRRSCGAPAWMRTPAGPEREEKKPA